MSQLGRSLSSVESVGSSATVRRRKIRSLSSSSLSSTGSLLSLGSRVNNSERRHSLSAIFGRGSHTGHHATTDQPTIRLNDVDEDGSEAYFSDDGSTVGINTAQHSTCEDNAADTREHFPDLPDSPEPKAFRRWVSTLRRKKLQGAVPVTPRSQRWTLDDFDARHISSSERRPSQHHKSNSIASSAAFVTAVKSASSTIATASIATMSRRNSRWRRGQQHSSILSGSEPRPSVDTQRSVMDAAAIQRSRRRREKLEELVRTEEGYLADLKALSSALFTLLGRLTNLQGYVRSCATTTLSRMIAVHHSLLCRLQQAVPSSDYAPVMQRGKGHMRWYSIDGAVPTRKRLGSLRQERRSLDTSRSSSGNGEPHLLCDPSVVLAVTTIFDEHIAKFSAYDDFGEQYELVRFAVEQAQQSTACWPEYDTAIETLAYTLNPVQSRDANRRKALSVKDLLIKPIQRLPRYVLLLNDLQKLTPVCDGPNAHEALGPVIAKLEASCEQVNRSRNSLDKKRLLGSTWLISERLSFHNQLPRAAFVKLLGPVTLCGCLLIAYRSKDSVKGRYAICVLFDTTLLLAGADEDACKYNVLAGVALANSTIAEADNGKGIQCHTAPHSWKMVYEHHTKMYEIMFTACSAVEADAWRQRILACAAQQATAALDRTRGVFELHSPLVEDMKTVGKALGNAGSFIRRMSQESIRRAATVASTTNLSQVIIKNTQACKEALDNSSRSTLQLPRSQSVATPSHVQTLAPRRADRVRLEALLADVWTKTLLPYPGIAPRRSDPLRASANHVMRKFSMASITSNFSTAKRNASYTSIATTTAARSREDPTPPPPSILTKPSLRERAVASNTNTTNNNNPSATTRPPLVDFHNAPEAFLPEDFDLSGSTAKRKRSALRTFTLSMERPFSPLIGGGGGGENKPAGLLRRTQSVRGGGEGDAGTVAPVVPVYSVVQQRAGTPGPGAGLVGEGGTAAGDEEMGKTARKVGSRNVLRRIFA
ncbi:hypothetical protein LTR74_001864 [Friedmanniomyces endolithicus]|nr:hypothetical protein LTR74_001864 [Friedmanniomyces endolithicus]